MTHGRNHQLSKSRFLAGLQCLKWLYLDCHHRDLAEAVPQRHSRGGGYFEQRKAERATRRLLSDSSAIALCEAALTFEGVHSRVDILRANRMR